MKTEWAPCIECNATGEVFLDSQTRFVTCPTCNGKKGVVANVICACGLPITTISADKLAYCGAKTCLLDLRTDKIDALTPPKPPAASGIIPFGANGPMYASQWHRNFNTTQYPGAYMTEND